MPKQTHVPSSSSSSRDPLTYQSSLPAPLARALREAKARRARLMERLNRDQVPFDVMVDEVWQKGGCDLLASIVKEERDANEAVTRALTDILEWVEDEGEIARGKDDAELAPAEAESQA